MSKFIFPVQTSSLRVRLMYIYNYSSVWIVNVPPKLIKLKPNYWFPLLKNVFPNKCLYSTKSTTIHPVAQVKTQGTSWISPSLNPTFISTASPISMTSKIYLEYSHFSPSPWLPPWSKPSSTIEQQTRKISEIYSMLHNDKRQGGKINQGRGIQSVELTGLKF